MQDDLKRYAKIIKTLRLELNKIEPESNAAWTYLKDFMDYILFTLILMKR